MLVWLVDKTAQMVSPTRPPSGAFTMISRPFGMDVLLMPRSVTPVGQMLGLARDRGGLCAPHLGAKKRRLSDGRDVRERQLVAMPRRRSHATCAAKERGENVHVARRG